MYVGKNEVSDFSDKVVTFIEMNGLENEYGNLICDYIEELFLKGYPVLNIDMEKQIYVFYNYLMLYNDILQTHGEVDFINHIVNEEISKN